MMRNYYYLNPDKSVRPCTAEEWSDQFEQMSILHSRQVALDEVDGNKISTVWLGINYNFNGDKPKILETMVFEKESHSDIYCVRYSTWEEAEKGHAKAIEWVKAGCVEE